jgi:mannosyltransferase OCH1-like enzyme
MLTTGGGFPDVTTEILDLMTDDYSARKENITKGSLQEAHLSWKENNPGYEIRYFNLNTCRQYLQRFYHPLFLRAFDCIEAFAGKTDLFRYLLIYREGGWYSDWKQHCNKEGLLDWIAVDNYSQHRYQYPTTWFSAFDKEPGRGGKMFGSVSWAMQNALFGSIPKSPILADAIRFVLRNMKMRVDLMPDGQAIAMTGPVLFGAAVQKNSKMENGMIKYSDGVRLGMYNFKPNMKFHYKGEVIVSHKCDQCSKNQTWSGGNDYFNKAAMGEYFCPDAPSLYLD